MRNLNQDSSSIAGVLFAAFGAAMLQVHENLKRPPNDVIRFASCDIDYKTDATCVVLELRIVQTLFRRQCGEHVHRPQGQVVLKGCRYFIHFRKISHPEK